VSAPILRDVPDQFESERLILRSPRPGDGAALHDAVTESLAELRPWEPWAHVEQSVAASEAYVRQAHADFLTRRNLALHLLSRDDGSLVGSSGLHHIEWSIPKFEIGYWIRTSRTGQGYATEAARRIADFAFAELAAERLEIWCDARNERSAAVARRAGFELETRVPRNRRDPSGDLVDSLCFVRLRDR
jgi:RimJ/RimL family protein N-acetyltransferase